LLDYLLKLEQTLVDPTAPAVKPVNFIVITDGAPTDDPESIIITAARRLDRNNFPLSQVGIQFVQIGTDPEATEALRELDDELSGKHSIRVSASCLLELANPMLTSLIGHGRYNTILGTTAHSRNANKDPAGWHQQKSR
jgi:hypothetical protein